MAEKEPKGIGGWLLILVILMSYILFILGLRTIGKLLITPVTFFANLSNWVMLISVILLAVTLIGIFKNKKYVRTLFYFTVWFSMIYLLISEFSNYSYSFSSMIMLFFKYFIIPLLITLYFVYSKRIKNTLIKK